MSVHRITIWSLRRMHHGVTRGDRRHCLRLGRYGLHCSRLRCGLIILRRDNSRWCHSRKVIQYEVRQWSGGKRQTFPSRLPCSQPSYYGTFEERQHKCTHEPNGSGGQFYPFYRHTDGTGSDLIPYEDQLRKCSCMNYGGQLENSALTKDIRCPTVPW